MDKKGRIQDVALALMTAFMLLPEDHQRRMVAGGLRVAGRVFRGVAAGAGKTAIRCETTYYKVLQP